MNTEMFSKQVPILLEALGIHMREHDLPLPLDIDIDEHAEVVTLRVASAHSAQQRWIDTLVVDSEVDTASRVMGPAWVSTRWMVRLPNLGLRFAITGHRVSDAAALAGTHLTVVPA